MIRLYLILAIITVLITAGGGAFMYVTSLQNRVATLQVNNAKFESAVKIQQETIKRQTADAAKFQELNNKLSLELKTAEAGLDKLRQTLANHDLTKLVVMKPGLIETKINDATNDLFNQLKIDTGSTPPPPVDNSTK